MLMEAQSQLFSEEDGAGPHPCDLGEGQPDSGERAGKNQLPLGACLKSVGVPGEKLSVLCLLEGETGCEGQIAWSLWPCDPCEEKEHCVWDRSSGLVFL